MGLMKERGPRGDIFDRNIEAGIITPSATIRPVAIFRFLGLSDVSRINRIHAYLCPMNKISVRTLMKIMNTMMRISEV